MSNDMAVFSNADLPSVTSLTTALRSLQEPSPAGGSAILKMDKTGHWVFGADQTEVQEGSQWAVNPFSFVHGSIAWGDGIVLAEKMTSINNPKPELDAAPAGATRGWEPQIGMSLKCLTGDDAGMEVRYSATSIGGRRGVTDLATALATQVEKDQNKPVPVVTLEKEHYQHKSYGRIFTPVFAVVSWMAMDSAEAAAPAPAPAEEAPVATRRRRAVA